MATKKAALLEGKARREERAKAVAKRSASVVRLMDLESSGIRLEKEAVVGQSICFVCCTCCDSKSDERYVILHNLSCLGAGCPCSSSCHGSRHVAADVCGRFRFVDACAYGDEKAVSSVCKIGTPVVLVLD